MSEQILKSVNIWQSYKQKRGYLIYTSHNILLKDEKSAQDNHVLACNLAKYSPIIKSFSLADSAINLS